MSTYYVDLDDGAGDPIEMEAEGPEEAIRKALLEVDTDDFGDVFGVTCGEEPDGSDAWSYSVTIERIERVHVRRSR